MEVDKAPAKNSREWVFLSILLIIACFQLSFGGSVSESGEQTGMSIPAATIAIGIILIALFIYRRKVIAASFNWVHMAALALFALGILGLSGSDLKQAVKECIQLGEIFVLAAYIGITFPKEQHKKLFKIIGYISIFLIVTALFSLYIYTPFNLSPHRFYALAAISSPFAIIALRPQPKILYAALVFLPAFIGFKIHDAGLLIAFIAAMSVCFIFLNNMERGILGAGLVLAVVLPFISVNKPWSSLNSQYDSDYRKRIFIEQDAALKAPSYYPFGTGLGNYKKGINILRQLLNDSPSPNENTIAKDSNNQYLLILQEAGLPAMLGFAGLILFLIIKLIIHYKNSEEREESVIIIAAALTGLLIASYFCTTLGKGIGIWVGILIGLSSAVIAKESLDYKAFAIRLAVPAGVFLLTFICLMTINKESANKQFHLSKLNSQLALKSFDSGESVTEDPGKKNGLKIISFDEDGNPQNSNSLVIQAEDYISITKPFRKKKVVIDETLTDVLDIPLKSGKGTGHVEYETEIKESGTYKIYARVHFIDGCSNSIEFLVNGSRHVLTDEQFKRWHSISGLKSMQLEKGKLKIRMNNTEDGVSIDYFELRKMN